MKTIYMTGDVGYEITADKLLQQIDMKSKEKLRVFVNSPGGFVSEAFTIYNIFKSYQGEIEFVIIGYALSAMSYIVMAGDKISAFKNSVWMAHRVQGIALGTAEEFESEAKLMKSLENVIIEAYQTRIKDTKESILEKMKNELWLVGWEQLTDFNIIDNVIDSTDEIEIEEEEKDNLTVAISEATNEISNNLLTMKLKKVESRMRIENENLKNSYEKVAAFFKMENSDSDISEKNNISEVDMDLKEFLEKNPEAKAEYESNLQSAEEKGKEIFNKDRERIAGILKCANVNISEEIVNAIESGIDDGQFAKEELARQREKRDETNVEKSVFGDLVKNQTPGEQDKTVEKEEINEEDFDKESKAFANKILFGGKK